MHLLVLVFHRFLFFGCLPVVPGQLGFDARSAVGRVVVSGTIVYWFGS